MIQSDNYISGGLTGTDQTVTILQSLKERSASLQAFRDFIVRLLRSYSVDPMDVARTATFIKDFVRNKIQYVPDPLTTEYIQAPMALLETKAGDCDDMALFIGSALEAVGIPTRFVTTGSLPDNMEHVYTEVFVNGSWQAADPVVDLPLGEYVNLGSKRIYNHNFKGADMSDDEVYTVVYNKALENIQKGVQAGNVDATVLLGYQNILDSNQSPFASPVINEAIRNAVLDSLPEVSHRKCCCSRFGLRGFFDDLFQVIKETLADTFGGTSVEFTPGGEVVVGGPEQSAGFSKTIGYALLGGLLLLMLLKK